MFATKLRHNFNLFRKVFSLYSPQQRCTMASEFPTTIKAFGYAFNDAGKLRKINPDDDTITDTPYEFQVSSDAHHNQARYEALGEVITEHVYQMLIDAGLHKIYVPSPETDTSSFVFGTKTDFKNTKKLLFLIHGSGVVRAGQWSRSLIINQSIDHGTQIPYIKRAVELGYDVLVTNTNHNDRMKDGERIYLDGNGSPEQHIKSVWDQLIEPALDTIDSFAVVAHSYGGVVTLRMINSHPRAFLEKCFAIGFTDSVHFGGSLSNTMLKWFRETGRNYVTSSKPLNTLLSGSTDAPCYSAGHTKHEWTSWACIDALFPYLEEKYTEFIEEDQKDNESDHGKDDNGKVEEKEDGGGDAQESNEEKAESKNDEEKASGKNNDDESDVQSPSPKKHKDREDL